MNVRNTIEELTQIGIEIRQSLESSLDSKEQKELVLRHIKVFSKKETRIADFQTGRRYRMLRNRMFKKSKKENIENTININRLNVAGSNRSLCSNEKKTILLTEEEIREYLKFVEREKILDEEISNLRIKETEFRSTQETMDLLHKYNDIKDVTQTVIGTLAVVNRTTIRNLYEHYDLSLEED